MPSATRRFVEHRHSCVLAAERGAECDHTDIFLRAGAMRGTAHDGTHHHSYDNATHVLRLYPMRYKSALSLGAPFGLLLSSRGHCTFV